MLWWAVQTLVVAALLAGAVQMVCRFGRLGPVARHALWLVVLAKLVVPPISALSWPWAVPDPLARSTRVAPSQIRVETIERSVARASFDEAAVGAPAILTTVSTPAPAALDAWRPVLLERIHEWRATILWIWLAGSSAFALIQIIRIVRLALRLRRAEPAPDALTEVVAIVARRLAMAPIRIRVVDGMSSPLVYRAELLWPRHLDQETSARGLEGLIAHELAHVKRRDHWVGWLELVAGVVWWWNPLFWYLRSQIAENAELACDAWVVDTLPNGRRAYAEALLAICARPAGTTPSPWACSPAVVVCSKGDSP